VTLSQMSSSLIGYYGKLASLTDYHMKFREMNKWFHGSNGLVKVLMGGMLCDASTLRGENLD